MRRLTLFIVSAMAILLMDRLFCSAFRTALGKKAFYL